MTSKAERTELFFRRLASAAEAASAEAAMKLVADTLNAVEDEFTSIPYSPSSHEQDGRLYPPQEDARRNVPDHPEIARYRNRAHNTWIAENGAIRITEGQRICLEKPGADGRTISSLMDNIGSKSSSVTSGKA